jgi:hypothetical protein
MLSHGMPSVITVALVFTMVQFLTFVVGAASFLPVSSSTCSLESYNNLCKQQICSILLSPSRSDSCKNDGKRCYSFHDVTTLAAKKKSQPEPDPILEREYLTTPDDSFEFTEENIDNEIKFLKKNENIPELESFQTCLFTKMSLLDKERRREGLTEEAHNAIIAQTYAVMLGLGSIKTLLEMFKEQKLRDKSNIHAATLNSVTKGNERVPKSVETSEYFVTMSVMILCGSVLRYLSFLTYI